MKRLFFSLISFLIVFTASVAFAASIVVKFDAPVKRADNSLFCTYVGQTGCPLPGLPAVEVNAYNLYYGTTTPPTTKVVITVPPFVSLATGMTYTLTGLNLNTPYYLAMSTTDEFNQESAITPIISKTTPIPALPGAPTNFSAPTAGVM